MNERILRFSVLIGIIIIPIFVGILGCKFDMNISSAKLPAKTEVINYLLSAWMLGVCNILFVAIILVVIYLLCYVIYKLAIYLWTGHFYF
jgi:hypothetical protein